MKRIKLLCLSYILLWAGFEQVCCFKFIIRKINGTLSVDLLKLPTGANQFEIRSDLLEDIGPGAICTNPALQIVIIDFTKTLKPPILRPDMFENCENLSELAIDGNEQKQPEWQDGILQHFANLKLLRAKHCSLHRPTKDFFTGANSLLTLSFSKCRIEEITSESFEKLKNLENFSLRSNKIALLPGSAFQNLSSLRTLDLSHNKISVLRRDAFDGLSSLESLDLSHNRLASTEEIRSGNLDKLRNLKSLSLKSNGIALLPEFLFQNLSSLKTLDLSNNKISVLERGAFGGLSSLESLDLSSNQIAALEGIIRSENFDKMKNLESSPLKSNESLFQNLSSLKTLDLSHNKISVLGGGAFGGLCSLESLDLTLNQITGFADQIPRSPFDDLKNLKTLSLRSNKISSLPTNLFKNLSELKRLDLSFTSITQLSWDEVDGLSSLEILEFRFSRISFFDADKIFKHMSNLKKIIVDGNTGNCTVVKKSASELRSKFGHDVLKSRRVPVSGYGEDEACTLKNH